jgi:SAM-dependent methyltransferase
MNSEEYAKLDRIDREHWFYRGKRDIVRYWMRRYVELEPADLVVDAGCGTGAMLRELSTECRAVGLDDHQESIDLARRKLNGRRAWVIQTALSAIPLEAGCAAGVLLLDVLEHLDRPEDAVQEAIRVMQPGGLLIVTVPALRWLWSDWDVALHHRRRYHRPDLRELVSRPELEILHLSYINTAMLLPIAGVRVWRKLFPPAPGGPRAEDRVPPGVVNSILRRTFVGPACWPWFRAPIGVSLLAVLRRR